jgi:hypothetical protein
MFMVDNASLRSRRGAMRQPDCFIVDGAIVLIVWLVQWGTLFSGDSSEANRSEEVR